MPRTARRCNPRPSGSRGGFKSAATIARYERPAVRWLSRYAAEDHQLRLAEARELVDLLAAVGPHDQVAQLRLERFLRARGFGEEADRVA